MTPDDERAARGHQKMADALRAAGWLVIPPIPADGPEVWETDWSNFYVNMTLAQAEDIECAPDSVDPPATRTVWTKHFGPGRSGWFHYERDGEIVHVRAMRVT